MIVRKCPFGCEHEHYDECEHFIGWTNDGRTIEPSERYALPKAAAPRTVLDTDRVVNTGVSARVYREGGLS